MFFDKLITSGNEKKTQRTIKMTESAINEWVINGRIA